jgi:mannose-6-phosphate isomerase-like protein (cupin superfamily)
MIVRDLSSAVPFTTKDGSTIRSLLDLSCAPVQNQSLAEASIPVGGATARHRHARTEELYYVVQGRGWVEIEGEGREVKSGDAILIPAGQAHKISNRGTEDLRILCCCAPPYSHDDTQLLE